METSLSIGKVAEGQRVLVEVVDDSTYQRQKSRLFYKIFAGNLFGDRVEEISGQASNRATVVLPAAGLRRGADTLYWVRAAALVSEQKFGPEKGFDRFLYTLVGLPSDVVAGYCAYGSTYLPGDVKVFYQWAFGPWRPFWAVAQ